MWFVIMICDFKKKKSALLCRYGAIQGVDTVFHNGQLFFVKNGHRKVTYRILYPLSTMLVFSSDFGRSDQCVNHAATHHRIPTALQRLAAMGFRRWLQRIASPYGDGRKKPLKKTSWRTLNMYIREKFAEYEPKYCTCKKFSTHGIVQFVSYQL